MADTFLTPTELFKRWDLLGLKISVKTIERWRHKNEGPPYFRVTDLPRGLIRYPVKGVEKFENEMFRHFTFE